MRSAHVPDRRTGTNPAEDRREIRQEGPDMAGKGHRRRPNWDHVERGVKLTLRIAAEVVRLIIEIRGGHL
jgi:hypothetical protein